MMRRNRGDANHRTALSDPKRWQQLRRTLDFDRNDSDHDEVASRLDSHWRAQAMQRKTCKRIQKSGRSDNGQQYPDDARQFHIKKRRLKFPAVDPPWGAARKNRAEPRTAFTFDTAALKL